MRRVIRHLGLAVALTTSICRFAHPQQQNGSEKTTQAQSRQFSERDALNTLQRIDDALESHSEQEFLAEFDAGKFRDYAVFRDHVHTFFAEYESFQASYHLQQVAMQASNGVALADFTLQARYAGGDQPDIRQEVQLRLVLGWDGKGWKIVGLSPRRIFGGS